LFEFYLFHLSIKAEGFNLALEQLIEPSLRDAQRLGSLDLRLSEALGTSAGHWLALQMQRDLWTSRLAAK